MVKALKTSRLVSKEAVKDQIFGVPIFIFDDEQFWGADRLWLLEERLMEAGLKKVKTE